MKNHNSKLKTFLSYWLLWMGFPFCHCEGVKWPKQSHHII